MSTVGIHPPKTPVTKGSMGIAKATLPNVCKMPGPPAPFVPAPLPNIAKSGSSPKDYSTSVKIDGNTVAIRGAMFESMGDVASKGTGGGLISANTHGPAKFITPGSMSVKIEGKSVHLLGEPMLNNCGPSGSPPNTGATMTGLDQSDQKPPVVGAGGPPGSNPCDDAKKEKERACTSIPTLKKGNKIIENFKNPKMTAHITCAEIIARIQGFDRCLAARKEVTKHCFGGVTDQRHADEEAALARGKASTQALGQTKSSARPNGC